MRWLITALSSIARHAFVAGLHFAGLDIMSGGLQRHIDNNHNPSQWLQHLAAQAEDRAAAWKR